MMKHVSSFIQSIDPGTYDDGFAEYLAIVNENLKKKGKSEMANNEL